ncbi:MAG: alpha-galactosidase [Clostridia bacterium]|nr:alpha-galactosidase [Clostridia bacterium]
MRKSEIDFTDVHYIPGDEPVFCFRTGLTVYEECFSHGMLTVSGWNTAGYPLNVLGLCPTRMSHTVMADPEAFLLDINGCSCTRELEFVRFDVSDSDEKKHAVLCLENRRYGITVKVNTILDGTAFFERYIEITNETDKPVSVSKLAPMSGAVETLDLWRYSVKPEIDGIYDLGYFDCEFHGFEGDFLWHPLRTDVTSFCGRYTRHRYRAPMFMLRNNLSGNVLAAQLAYSGGYRFNFDYRAHYMDGMTYLGFSAEIDSFRPLYVLRPGETLTSPSLHIGMIHGDADAAINAMHAHTRKSVLCLPEANREGCVICSGIGPENELSVENIKGAIDQMAEAGAEAFFIDAGWYVSPSDGSVLELWWQKAGDWNYSTERYQNGLAEISEYAKSKGLKFGLWMEPERIGAGTALYEKHRDWFTVHYDGEQSDGYLDLTKKEVVNWCESEISRVITDYHLDLFRLDYNVDTSEYFHVNCDTGIRECMAIRQVEGFYRLYGRLKKRFPDVVFENCAGGGGRCDLGMLRFFDHTWVSDNQIPPRSLLITNGMTMLLPPERVDRLVAGMNCHTAGSLDFHMRNAMLSHMSLNCFAQSDFRMNSDVFAFVKHSTDLYKSFIRPMLSDCLIYHHNFDSNEILKNGVCAIEESLPGGERGVICVFSMPRRADGPIIIRPKGASAGKKYLVTFDNSRQTVELTGYQMMCEGITVSITSGLSSELITYRLSEDTDRSPGK